MTEQVIRYPAQSEPAVFTQDELGWLPWLEPLPESALTDRHRDGLVDPARAKSPYFMLLVRDPKVLEARTRTDKDIFYNTRNGLSRAEREVAATATSRVNGCIFCASVHARFATVHSKRRDEVQTLLEDGVGGVADPRWAAIARASEALTETPSGFGVRDIQALAGAGLSDLEIVDVINGAAFFNWANRLMLSLGQPEQPVAA